MLCEIGRGRPRIAAIQRLEESIAPYVQNSRVVGRDRKGRAPVEAVLLAHGRRRHDVARHRAAEEPEARAGLHFVVFNPTSDDFHRNRLAMDGVLPGGRRLPLAR